MADLQSSMIGINRPPILVISEPDHQGALAHRPTLPFAPGLPHRWDRQRLLGLVRAVVGKRPKVGDVFEVASGVLAQVKHFGVDLAGWSGDDRRLQVCLSIRGWGTDPNHVVEL
jgi:hypothetical protein